MEYDLRPKQSDVDEAREGVEIGSETRVPEVLVVVLVYTHPPGSLHSSVLEVLVYADTPMLEVVAVVVVVFTDTLVLEGVAAVRLYAVPPGS